MTTQELYHLLALPQEVVQRLEAYHDQPRADEAVIQAYLTRATAEEGLAQLTAFLGEDPDGMKLLHELLEIARDTWDKYETLGVSHSIFVQTMRFVTRFLRSAHHQQGVWRFTHGWWFWRELAMVEFRMGSLEYELVEENGGRFISLHIPSDADMRPDAVNASLNGFRLFMEKFFPEWTEAPWRCCSWMMAPALRELLPEDSNILAFQRRFEVESVDEDSLGVLDWVFPPHKEVTPDLPEDTVLQKRVKAWLLAGKKIGWANAVLREPVQNPAAPFERLGNPLNPVSDFPDNRYPDPHIKIFTNPDTGREAMYVYVGHDDGFNEFIMRDWYVMWSEDLVSWQCARSLERKDTFMPADSINCWACDCVQSPWDGKYYLYYSNAGESTGVAVSDRPQGPFTDARDKKTPILPKGITPTNSYDPDIILPDQDDPHAYILFGSDWTDHYWAMQLNENMTEVVPGTGRKVPVYPADGTPTELLGVLRSDQAEVFRRSDTWYMYWAGRYSTSTNRLGPYIFHSDLGLENPHYPDGRCFIDHGSFLEWHGQWFYAVSHGTESWSFRQSWLMYLHFTDDGSMMIDETIRRCGVGQYCAKWHRIEAEWYMAKGDGLKKIELHQPDGSHAGFAISQQEGVNEASFPHVYALPDSCTLTLRAKGEPGASIEVLCGGKSLGRAEIDSAAFADYKLPLSSLKDEQDFTLRLSGCVTLDWLRFA